MKSKFRKNLIAASAVLALTCVAVGGVASYLDEGAFDISAAKTAAYVAAAESLVPTSNGSVYYVSPDVAYDNTGAADMGSGTEDDPYNIVYLLNNSETLLSAGDTVVVLPGTYKISTPIVAKASGAYNNYITVISAADYDSKYSGDSVLSFYGMTFYSTNRGVSINGDYIYWYNVDVCGAGDNGMYIAGNYNIIENSEFYNNRDTGLQLGREASSLENIDDWPSYNLIKNCTSYNNYDNETYGENADGFAAKLTVGYGNIFDGCIAYRNSDDGWDLYAKADSGNIGCVIIYNCVAFENGFLMESQATCNARFVDAKGESTYDSSYNESDTSAYTTRDGDGNGFKLGGGVNEGDVILYNCMAFNNAMHGVTDNSNPGTLMIEGVTSYNNGTRVSSSGAIDYSVTVASADQCNNIDVARWDYSYNILSDVISVIGDSAQTGSDAYRGSAESSMFTSNYITDNIDSYSKDSSKRGAAYSDSTYSKPTKSVFKATPELTMGTDCGTYDSDTHQYSKTIHANYRNDDGSINMGDILAINDYSGLVSSTIGCVLNGTSWDSYTHYDYTLVQNCSSEDNAEATAIKNMLYVPVNQGACYQDFDVVAHMLGNDITWTSSNSSVLSVSDEVEKTKSSSQSVTVVVYRQAEDTEVTLTASVTVGSETVTKEFKINVVAADYEVGDIVAEGVENVTDGSDTYGQLILDQYQLIAEPEVTVYDGSDYSGKTLSTDKYTMVTTYEYAKDRTSTYYQIAGFTTSTAGVYKITQDVTLNNADTTDGTKVGNYMYYIYVSSTTAKVSLADTSVTANKDGFILEATPSNVTGIVYTYVSSTAIDNITAETVIANGIATEYRTTDYSQQYENANSSAYYIYFVVTDVDGKNTSEVYTKEVGTVEVGTVEAFNSMLASSDSSKVYVLTADIDFENAAVGTSDTFSAVLNGMGHTIKNVSGSQYIFSTVKNGTIMNVKFENIVLTHPGTTQGSDQKNATGIIGVMNGGYVYNVVVTNVSVTSTFQRTGGLIGQITATSGTGSTNYIQNVSLINGEGYSITNGSAQRAGGLVGYIQAGNSSGWTIVYISDCYVNTDVSASEQVGGVIGVWSDQNAKDYLSITCCVTAGTLTSIGSTSRVGGILGYNKDGSGTMKITNCVCLADLVFGGEILTAALKNASCIVGGFSTATVSTVSNCFAAFTDYNEEFLVSAWSTDALKSESWWTSTVGLSSDYWTILGNSPYVSLNYLS